jgi:hypothetical protein
LFLLFHLSDKKLVALASQRKTKENGAHPKKRRRTATHRRHPNQPPKKRRTIRKKTSKTEAIEKKDEIY